MNRRSFMCKSACIMTVVGLGMIGAHAGEPVSEKKYVVIPQRCNGCGHCYKACRDKALSEVSGKANIEAAKCNGCGECTRFCRHMAIVVEKKPE